MTHAVPQDVQVMSDRDTWDGGGGSRAGNQQLIMRVIHPEALATETLTNPGRITEVVTERFPYLTLDDSLTAGEMAGSGGTIMYIRPDDIDMFSLPTNGVGRARGQSVVRPDEQAIEAIGSALSQGEMASYRTGQ